MSSSNKECAVEARLRELNIILPAAAAPAANYVPYHIIPPFLYISGQLPMENGKIKITGTLGKSLDVSDGTAAARLCGLQILAQAKAALGALSRIEKIIRLGGFVSSTPDFYDHPQVINGASDLMAEILGEAGKHTRFAVGTSSLPLNAAVEIDAQIKIREQ